VAYVVEVIGSDKFKGTEIRVTLAGMVTDGNFGLDKSIYENAEPNTVSTVGWAELNDAQQSIIQL
jgi:hypothetical protein